MSGEFTVKKGNQVTYFADLKYSDVDIPVIEHFRDAPDDDDLTNWVIGGSYQVVGYDPSCDSLLTMTWHGNFHIGHYRHYGNGKIYWVNGVWLDASSPKDSPRYTVTYTPRYWASIDAEGFSRDALDFFGYKWLDDEKRLVRRFEYLGRELPRVLSE